MKELESYIQESIFDKDVDRRLKDEREAQVLDVLRKYSYDTLDEHSKSMSFWKTGSYEYKNGKLYIDCGKYGVFHLNGLPKQSIDLNIAQVKGPMCIPMCIKNCMIEDLEHIFAPDCEVTQILSIYSSSIKSLKGCPKRCGGFVCEDNPFLDFSEYVNGPERIIGTNKFRYVWRYNKNCSYSSIEKDLAKKKLMKKYKNLKSDNILIII